MKKNAFEIVLVSAMAAFAAAILLPSCSTPGEMTRRATSPTANESDLLRNRNSSYGYQQPYNQGGWVPPVERAGGRGGLPPIQAGEELWVIQQPETRFAADDEAPGTGALLAKLPGGEEEVPVPLKHTDVQARVAGYLASVAVEQQYENPYDAKIEAVYVFPLPQNAAVHDFVMTIGERRIRGIIRKREEAEQIYAEARAQGYVASLLTQERPNIFRQSVANIEPGRAIDINITYYQTLAYDDGYYEFVFPMVVGPRYNPPGMTSGVGAVGRGSEGTSGQATELSYLKPGERSGHDISLSVDIEAGLPLADVVSVNHVIETQAVSATATRVRLHDEDAIPNKDFVLRYQVAGETLQSAMLTHEDDRGGFFTLMIVPPEDVNAVPRAPVELVFVLDCSGSMSDKPIKQAKAAMAHALTCMRPDDTFQIIRFSDNASTFGDAPLAATRENVAEAKAYVAKLSGSGGTHMIKGIRAALDFPHEEGRVRFVVFLTDGYIGNETQILAAIHEKLGASRIFSFGVGSSPNRYLLDRMASVGRGAVAYLSLEDDGAAVMDRFFGRISHPALRDIAVDWGALAVSDVYPRELPDVFPGRPVIITGRYRGSANEPIRIRGRVGDERREISVRPRAASDIPALPPVWARAKIADLYTQAAWDDTIELPQMIEDTALTYGLMSAYTAFVAVDSTHQTAGDHGTTVAVPVPAPVPEGVKYETTVTE